MTTMIALFALALYLVFYFTFGKTLRDKLGICQDSLHQRKP